MDLNKLIGYNRSSTHAVDMEGVIHAVPSYHGPNLRSSTTDLRPKPDKPPVNNSPPHEKERPSSSRSFWSTVMDFPPSSASPASTPSAAATSVNFPLGQMSPSTPSNTNLSTNTEREMVHCDRAESEHKP